MSDDGSGQTPLIMFALTHVRVCFFSGDQKEPRLRNNPRSMYKWTKSSGTQPLQHRSVLSVTPSNKQGWRIATVFFLFFCFFKHFAFLILCLKFHILSSSSLGPWKGKTMMWKVKDKYLNKLQKNQLSFHWICDRKTRRASINYFYYTVFLFACKKAEKQKNQCMFSPQSLNDMS